MNTVIEQTHNFKLPQNQFQSQHLAMVQSPNIHVVQNESTFNQISNGATHMISKQVQNQSRSESLGMVQSQNVHVAQSESTFHHASNMDQFTATQAKTGQCSNKATFMARIQQTTQQTHSIACTQSNTQQIATVAPIKSNSNAQNTGRMSRPQTVVRGIDHIQSNAKSVGSLVHTVTENVDVHIHCSKTDTTVHSVQHGQVTLPALSYYIYILSGDLWFESASLC